MLKVISSTASLRSQVHLGELGEVAAFILLLLAHCGLFAASHFQHLC